MAVIYLETSALVRRYDQAEPAAARVRAVCAPSRDHVLLIGQHTSVEVASALNVKVRTGAITPSDASRLWRLFTLHRERQYRTIVLAEARFRDAERLLFQFPLQTLDALHLACALAVATTLPNTTITFWTADQQQARAAIAHGILVELVS